MKPERISNCPLKFVCSKKWSDLRETDEPGRRFCTDCNKPVYLCRTKVDFEKRGSAGECVALELAVIESDHWDVLDVRGLVIDEEEEGPSI